MNAPDPFAPAERGLYPFLSFADYHANPAWGSSDLKTFRVGPPAMVPWKRANPSADTDATRLGTACHARILTPDLFDANYVVKPEDAPDRPTEAMLNAKKPSESSIARMAWWADWNARNGSKQTLSPAMGRDVAAIEEAVSKNARAWLSIVEAPHREASILWTCPDSGEPCKARPDWYDDDWCYDLKVSRHAGSGLAFRAYVEGWMAQSAHYVFGLRQLGLGAKRGGRLVVVHPKAPHHVYTVEIKSSALDILTLENVNTLRLMRVCREADDWPGTPDEWTPIAPPDYALQLTMGGLDLSDAEEGEAI